jgi:GntR family transcriptional regulator
MSAPDDALVRPLRSQTPAVDGGDHRRSADDASVLPRLQTRPLSSRVKDLLLESILSGAFPEGRLPTEPELSAQLGVSRATLRGALRTLEDQAIITRQRGVGTLVNRQVAESRISLNRVVGFHQLIQESGHKPGIDWTRLSEIPANDDVATRLFRDVGTPCLSIRRLLLADDAPAIYIEEIMALDELRFDVRGDDIPSSIFEFADIYLHRQVDHTIMDIGCTAATPELCELLDVTAGEPLLRMTEHHYCADDHPRIVSYIYVVDRYIRFTIVRTRL